MIEQDGTCYTVIAANCGELDLDPFGTGCKKPIGDASKLHCETGFTLVNTECLKDF